MSVALDLLILATGWTHVLLAPYNKVEESFTLHAVHDVLMYGVGADGLKNYDHHIFPGAVPRTFIGSILLAWISTPVIEITRWAGYLQTNFDIQVIVRLVLATFNAFTLCLLRRGAARRFGRPTGFLFTLLTCTQFHYPFWMGRTIPNMVATIPVNIATYLLLDRAPNAIKMSRRRVKIAISLLTFTAVVFRAEVALYLAPISLHLLSSRQISLGTLIKVGLSSGLVSVVLTVFIDSYFWDTTLLWPEFMGIYFNVFEGKSSDWGVSPVHVYFTSFLPKLLLSSFPLAILGLVLDKRIRSLLLPMLTFIGLISKLGHKEWRFIIYVVPVFNVAAARVASKMVGQAKGSVIGRLFFLIVSGLISANLLVTVLSTRASMNNYPGGEALMALHQMYPPDITPPPHIHISNLAAQTGASLFLQLNPHWIYNKTENLSSASLSSFTHLISESPLDHDFRIVKTIEGFDRWTFDKAVLKPHGLDINLVKRFSGILRMQKSSNLWILERKDT